MPEASSIIAAATTQQLQRHGEGNSSHQLLGKADNAVGTTHKLQVLMMWDNCSGHWESLKLWRQERKVISKILSLHLFVRQTYNVLIIS